MYIGQTRQLFPAVSYFRGVGDAEEIFKIINLAF